MSDNSWTKPLHKAQERVQDLRRQHSEADIIYRLARDEADRAEERAEELASRYHNNIWNTHASSAHEERFKKSQAAHDKSVRAKNAVKEALEAMMKLADQLIAAQKEWYKLWADYQTFFQTRYDQQQRPKRKTSPNAKELPSEISKQMLEALRAEIDKALADYGSMTAFPSFPALRCDNASCTATVGSRKLEACPCSIAKAFNMLAPSNLKAERTRWHPDRFAACPGDKRDAFQAMASEVFAVVNGLYEEERDRKRW